MMLPDWSSSEEEWVDDDEEDDDSEEEEVDVVAMDNAEGMMAMRMNLTQENLEQEDVEKAENDAHDIIVHDVVPDNEMNTDVFYVSLVSPYFRIGDVDCYFGPKSLTRKNRKLIEIRYNNTFKENFFPPSIKINDMRLKSHRRLQEFTDKKPWKTLVPPSRPRDRYTSVNKDDGGARLLGHFDIVFNLTQDSPPYERLLLETDGRWNIHFSNLGRKCNVTNENRDILQSVRSCSDDGLQSLGSVGASRLLYWKSKGWIRLIGEQNLAISAIADLQSFKTNDFGMSCVFAYAQLPIEPMPDSKIVARLVVYLREAIFGLSANESIKHMMNAVKHSNCHGGVVPTRQRPTSTNKYLRSNIVAPARKGSDVVSHDQTIKPGTSTSSSVKNLASDSSVYQAQECQHSSGPSAGKDGESDTATSVPSDCKDECRLQFNTRSLLCAAECTGYPLDETSITQPPGLSSGIKLRDYQIETLNWMLEQEKIVRPDGGVPGLNGYFWESRAFKMNSSSFVQPYYYFPLCGQLSLEKIPVVTGSLLSEEMGLGKTVEVISLILSSPAPDPVLQEVDLIIKELSEIEEEKRKAKAANESSRKRKLHQADVVKSEEFFGGGTPHDDSGSTRRSKRLATRNTAPEISRHRIDDAASPLQKTVAKKTANLSIKTPASKASLVVVPISLLPQWKKELEKKSPGLEVVVFHGEGMDKIKLSHILTADVVLAPYSSIQNLKRTNRSSNLLLKVKWWRLIVDEIQFVRNDTSKIASAMHSISSTHRWMLSGTPLTKKIDELQGVLSLLRVWPFALSKGVDKSGWTNWFWVQEVTEKWEVRDPQVLRTLLALMNGIMMRHSRFQSYSISDGNPPLRTLVPLPAATIRYVGLNIPLGSSEAYVNDIVNIWALELLERIEAVVHKSGSLGKNNYATMTGMLNRLKLCASCPHQLELSDLDSFHRRQCERHLKTAELDSGATPMPGALGMEDGISIMTAEEAQNYFKTKLNSSTGATYNREGLQLLMNMSGQADTDSQSKKCQVLACPVCLDEGEKMVRPVFMPCLHTICRDCLLDLFETKQNLTNSRSQTIICPYNCNAEPQKGYHRCEVVEALVASDRQAVLGPNKHQNLNNCIRDDDIASQSHSNILRKDEKFDGSLSLELSPTKCKCSWARLQSIPPPGGEFSDSTQQSAEYPFLPAMLLAHHRALFYSEKSAKIRWICLRIRSLLEEDITSKILILSQSNVVVESVCRALDDKMASILEGLEENGKSYVRADSSGSQEHRAKQLELFTDDPDIAVCVATRSVAGVGLNLTAANVVILLDPANTAGEENQAINRVIRLGQTRSVKIYKLYMKNTIEERILSWRARKGDVDANFVCSESCIADPATEVTSSDRQDQDVTRSSITKVLEEWRVLLGAV